MKRCAPSKSESNLALVLVICLMIASRSQSGGNISRPCPRLSKGLIAGRITSSREFTFWRDEGQNQNLMIQSLNQEIHSRQSQSKMKGSAKEHIHMIASDHDFSSHQDVLEGSLLLLCHWKKSKKFHWLVTI